MAINTKPLTSNLVSLSKSSKYILDNPYIGLEHRRLIFLYKAKTYFYSAVSNIIPAKKSWDSLYKLLGLSNLALFSVVSYQNTQDSTVYIPMICLNTLS